MNDDLLKLAEEATQKRRSTVYPTLPQGFTLRRNIRDGFIYFRREECILEIWWERSAVDYSDILLVPLELKHWDYPEKIPIEPADRTHIVDALEAWLHAQKIRADAFVPLKRPLLPERRDQRR